MAYSPEFKADIDKLVQRGYLKAYEGMIKAMCAPFWWSEVVPDKPARIVGSGTVCYVNTGTRYLGVTADHVYADYVTSKERFLEVDCQLGGNRFAPENHLIDRSPENELDLATFDVPEVFVSASPGRYHHNAPVATTTGTAR